MKCRNQALIVIDTQNDFFPGGNLAIPGAEAILPQVNQLISLFDHVIFTQDWHPVDHISFHSSHPDKQPFETIECSYGKQILWPKHCIKGTHGADFPPALHTEKGELILRKGTNKNSDVYSAFFENDRKTPTGLNSYCLEKNLTDLSFCGLATDFCVGYSALDAKKHGFKSTIYLGACQAIDDNNSLAKMLKKLADEGVSLLLHP